MSTKSDLIAEARELLSKATPGPWAQSALCNGYVIGPPCTDYPTILAFAEYTERGELHLEFQNAEHNMALVTRAPNLLSSLCNELETLRSQHAMQAESITSLHEQTKAMRSAIEPLISTAEFALSTPGFVRGRDAVKNAIEAARESITPKGEQS